ncbi:hypothetical protein PFRI_36500 [Planktotalea frisia]|uniref:Uncharacterized protein n=1 Tax=Planktotalea frisia TaxID=696762 RepID=A0A1L9NS73_9RHOB|nr:hypothetical protein PFRI_36500 [Planktotalea frisia]
MQEPKDPRMSGRIASIVLILLSLFVIMLVWIA